MAAVGAPESLAEALEADAGIPQLNYDLALKITTNMKLEKKKKPDWACVDHAAKCSLADLPLKLHIQGILKNTVMHLVDCIRDWQGELDEKEIAALMQENAIAQLPEIMRPKVPIGVPYAMNLCILKTAEKLYIIKHFMFGETLTLENAVVICHGQPLVIDLGRNQRSGVKPFVYMFQRLGGFQGFCRVSSSAEVELNS